MFCINTMPIELLSIYLEGKQKTKETMLYILSTEIHE